MNDFSAIVLNFVKSLLTYISKSDFLCATHICLPRMKCQKLDFSGENNPILNIHDYGKELKRKNKMNGSLFVIFLNYIFLFFGLEVFGNF